MLSKRLRLTGSLRRAPWSRRAALAAATCAVVRVTAAAQHPTSHAVGGGMVVQPLVFTGITVIDVTDGRRIADQVVLTSGNRIQSIGRAGEVSIPAGARVVDARGKYMIPGMWDMHVHMETEAPQLYPRFIAHGITGVREMAQRFPSGADSFRVWQREIMAGTRVGPRNIGPSADFPYHFSHTSRSQDVLRTVDSLKAAGMVFLKYHADDGGRNLFFAIAREARKVGLPILGHIPVSVTSIEASDSGMLTIEHIDEHHQCWPNYPAPMGDSTTVDKQCAPEVQADLRNGTWLVPTLATWWPEPSPHRQSAGVFKEALRMVRVLHRLGVTKFLAGTDWAQQITDRWEPQFLPGLSGAEEIVFFVEAGFTPLEALQTGTLNVAKYLNGTDSLGTVAPGKLADLVLLDGDPLEDIHNVLKVRAVVANGRYFGRATLDSLDPVGTKPGAGLVARELRRTRAYTANFVGSTDTTEVPLTDDLLTRYVALRTDLKTFWPQHAALRDSAREYEDYPVVAVQTGGGPIFSGDPRVLQVPVFDYVALAARDSALAGVFRKNNFPPEQYWAVHITVMKNVFHVKAADGAVAGTAARNVELIKARKADLETIGVRF